MGKNLGKSIVEEFGKENLGEFKRLAFSYLNNQYNGIVYLSETVKVHYIIETNHRLSNNIRVIVMICSKE